MCEDAQRILVTPEYGAYPHTDDGVEVRRIFHELRSRAIENFTEHFKAIFDGHAQVPTKGLLNTSRFALGAVFVYQLDLLYRHEHGQDLRVGLKAFLKAACAIMTTPHLTLSQLRCLSIGAVKSVKRTRCLPPSSKFVESSQRKKASSRAGHSLSIAAYQAVSRLRPL